MNKAGGDTPSCPICDASSVRPVLRWNRGHSIWRCDSCRTLFAHPMPSARQLDEFYQGFLYRRPDKDALRGLIDRKKQELIRLLRPTGGHAGRTFLDYGGGTGIAYQAARELGLDAYFQEVDRQAIAFVRETFAIPDNRLITSADDLGGQRYDCIFCDNVIEHVPDPRIFLGRLVSALRPEGTLIVKTPRAFNTEMYFYPVVLMTGYVRTALRHNSWAKAIYQVLLHRCWTCDPPRHLFAFSPRSFERLGRDVCPRGLRPSLDRYRVDLYEYSLTRHFLIGARSWKHRLMSVPLAPFLLLENLTKLVQIPLRAAGLVSAGGLILRIGPDYSRH